MHIFSESSQNIIARSKFLFPHFLNDCNISLCRFLNVPLKKIATKKSFGQWSLNTWKSGYTKSAPSPHSWAVGRCWLLLRRAPSPFYENGSGYFEDAAHPTTYTGERFWTQSYFFFPTDGQDLHNSLLPRHCEVWLQLRLQNHMFLLFTNRSNLDPMPEVCHGFH